MCKNILYFIFFLGLISCDKESKIEEDIAKIPVEISIDRFDQLLYGSPISEFKKTRKKYHYLFSPTVSDSVWKAKLTNPMYQELYNEVQLKYNNDDVLRQDLTALFQHIKYYFPKFKTPKVLTVISEMDYENKVVFTDTLAIISLDLYLGKDHRFYEFPSYIKNTFEYPQITSDLVSEYYYRKAKITTDKTLLSQMIYHGKEMYLKDLLIPSTTDANKMGYTEEQLHWCEENQAEMWRYFIERKLLYDTDKELVKRFVDKAPFSKFYLELDNESPGRVGVWLGWQIVRSYMQNNTVTLPEMLAMDENELFLKSKYKPKK